MPNIIVLNDNISKWGDSSAEMVREKLDSFGGQSVDVEINSPGGSVLEGLEIFHLFKNYTGFVTMQIMSMAASMASIIPLAGDKRIAHETTLWVIHNVFGGEWGDYRDLQKQADVLKSLRDLMANLYSKILNKNIKEMKKIMDAETWFFGDEALKFGLVDEIIMLPEKEDKENKSDAIAYAKIRIEDCYSQLKSEGKKVDYEKVAQLLSIDDKKNLDKTSVIKTIENNVQQPAGAGNNKKEVSKMTLEEFKNENPGLYNQIFNSGVTAGIENANERVAAHMEWVEVDPVNVKKAIIEGKDFNMASLSAYNKAALNKTDATNRTEDNVDATNTIEVDEETAVKDLTTGILKNMRSSEVENV